MKRTRNDFTGDLFAGSGAGDGGRGAATPASVSVAETVPVRLIASPLVQGTESWLADKAKVLGGLLAAERAVEYVAILRAFVEFRQHHEPEPLHEDLVRLVCGESPDPFDEQSFKGDIRQLESWELVTERIEKERLRGYRDTRRTKFRYRLCEEAVAFVEWLAERRTRTLEADGTDITGNLLDLQCSLLHELRRRLRAVPPSGTTYEAAGDVLYRVEQMRVYVEATARTLQALNLRLLAFGAESFSADAAKPVVDELALFLERFGRRFGALREDIVQDLAELRRPNQGVRWKACAEALRVEALKFRHIASVRIPDAESLLADAAAFYGTEGALVDLMQRIVDSARKVWGKLNAKLRELERRNHRLEDLGLRLAELSTWSEEDVPYDWLRGLMETAAMRGDAQIRPAGEKSRPPLPKASAKVRTKKTVTWITPRTVGSGADVASIAQVRGERLRDWLVSRGLFPTTGTTRLSDLAPRAYADFANVVRLVEYTRLGSGKKGRRYLGVAARATGDTVTLGARECSLTCENLTLSSIPKGTDHED